VSIRGSSSQQVRIAREGIPLDGAMSGAYDLASLPLDGVERVELYRGFIPVPYGGAAIGGVINVVGEGVARERKSSVWLGFGSFAGREGGVSSAHPWGKDASIRVRVGYAGSAGNFSIFDDGNTPTLPDDDSYQPRSNNDYDRVAVGVRIDNRRGQWRGFMEVLGGYRNQGVPGRGSAQTRETRLRVADTRLLMGVERRGFVAPGGRLQWLASVGAGGRSFSDPLGEVGLGADEQSLDTVDTYLSPRMRLPLWRDGFLLVSGDVRGEFVRIDEALPPSESFTGDSRRQRHGVGTGVQIEQFLADRRLQIVGGLRADALVSAFEVAPGQGEFDEAGQDTTTLALTPRLGLRATLAEGLSLRLSAGRYFRPPTLVELFGDQGFVLGREDLAAESGANFDLGFALDRKLGRARRDWSLFATLAGFGSFTQDLIAWVQAGPVVRPTNLEGARVLGVESSAQLTAPKRWVIAQVNYTFMDAMNLSEISSQNGQPLPGRPRHQVFARASVGREFGAARWEPRVFYGVDYAASSYLDPSGRFSLPPRNFHNVGAELHLLRRLDVAFEVRNLLDQRQVNWQPPIAGEDPVPTAVVDFIGYPLPGRSLWGSLRLRW
jgi:iron complex outermembrane receptor protein